jgi:photosystem II stability/assembly factor-like uncharacterized protein
VPIARRRSINAEPVRELSGRKRRALAVIGLAGVLTLAAGFGYIRSSGQTRPQSSAQSNQPRLLTLDSVSYYFVTPSLGWAIENPIQDGGFAVFRTTDGAKDWQKQMATFSSFSGPARIAVQFLDENHGYIAAADPFQRLFRTSDGGDHWESVRLPPRSFGVNVVAFSSPTFGWLQVVDRSDELYATSDAGTTWQRLPNPPSDAEGLSVRSPNEAWMGSSGIPRPHVYLSTDAGNTWRRRDVPPPPGTSWDGSVPTSVELLPDGGVHVFTPPVGDPHLIGLSETFTSFDQGATWNHVPQGLGAIAYQDSLHWWAMSETSLFKSSDAGQHWMLVTSALPDWHYVPHVHDSLHAWAGIVFFDANGLALTKDGGLHWSLATVPPPASSVSHD